MKTNDGEVGKEGGSGGSRQSSKKWALGVGERWQTRGGGGEGGWRGLVSGGEVKKKKRKKKVTKKATEGSKLRQVVECFHPFCGSCTLITAV